MNTNKNTCPKATSAGGDDRAIISIRHGTIITQGVLLNYLNDKKTEAMIAVYSKVYCGPVVC